MRGYSFLIQFGLAIFSKYQDEIMELSTDEIGLFLKNKLYELDENEVIIKLRLFNNMFIGSYI